MTSHVRLLDLGLVVVGGAAGSLGRTLVSGAVDSSRADLAFPLATLLVNLTGAFALGALVEAAARRGGPRWRRARLLLGTGALGGFTTYSLLAGELAGAALEGRFVWVIGYATATLLGGAAASCLGILVGGRIARTRGKPSLRAGSGR